MLKMSLYKDIKRLYSEMSHLILKKLENQDYVNNSLSYNILIATLVEFISIELICDDRPEGPIKFNFKEVTFYRY